MKRFKWEPIAAMIAVLALGAWLVYGQGGYGNPPRREGADVARIRMPAQRGWIEYLEQPPETWTFRVLYRNQVAGDVLDERDARRVFGDALIDRLVSSGAAPALFRLFNITTWTSLIWIVVGLGGQALFSGRMFVQWLISERRRQSVVPDIFWWMSLGGGLCLFTYFVWRQDIVGVLGQSSGLVIYARNIKLIHKRNRRARRDALIAGADAGGAISDAQTQREPQ